MSDNEGTNRRRSSRSGSASGGRRGAFNVPNPEPGGPPTSRTWYQPSRCCPYPSGNGMHMGHVLNYTMGDVITHVRPPQRLDGACARWAGTALDSRPRTRPSARAAIRARSPSATSRRSVGADEAPRLGDRLGPRGLRCTIRLLPLGRSGCSSKFYETGLAYRKEAPVNWCPNDQDRDRERVHPRRPLRALRRRCRAEEHDAVVLQDDRVRGRAARVRPPDGGDWPERIEDDPAQLDRPLGGCRDPVPRRRARPRRRRSSRRGRTRCTARRSSSSRPSTRSSSSCTRAEEATRPRVRAACRRQARRGARRRRPRRRASFTGHYATNPVNGERCRSGSPTTS